MPKKKILAISGSTRSHSTNLQLIKAIEALSADELEFDICTDIARLPHFNPDIDHANPPKEVAEFRSKIALADGVLICTPEYVFSLPGSLKNALEWTVSTTLFSEKPTAIITASLDGKNTHESLLLIMKTLGAKIGAGSSLLISGARTKIKSTGEISDEDTFYQIKGLIADFVKVLNENE